LPQIRRISSFFYCSNPRSSALIRGSFVLPPDFGQPGLGFALEEVDQLAVGVKLWCALRYKPSLAAR
jgi:hypothetical protein